MALCQPSGIAISPASGCSFPASSFSSVLFPQPLRPTITVSCPTGKDSDRSFSTCRVRLSRVCPVNTTSVL